MSRTSYYAANVYLTAADDGVARESRLMGLSLALELWCLRLGRRGRGMRKVVMRLEGLCGSLLRWGLSGRDDGAGEMVMLTLMCGYVKDV